MDEEPPLELELKQLLAQDIFKRIRLIRHALSLAIGSQALIALLDTAALDPHEARDVTRFVCSAIVNEVDRLAARGDTATAEKSLTPDMKALRKSLERDRYGVVAHVLVTRDGCTQFDCAAFRSLTDQQQVAANMDSHLYDTLVARHAPAWTAPAAVPAMPPTAALAGLPPSMPTGKPTNAEFPSASSTFVPSRAVQALAGRVASAC